MENIFTEASRAPQPDYDDVGSKILRDYNFFISGRPHAAGLNTSSLSLMEYAGIAAERHVSFPDMKAMGYQDFITSLKTGHVMLIHDGRFETDVELLASNQIGLANILNNKRSVRANISEQDQVFMAALTKLDPVDYLYAIAAIVPVYGVDKPLKHITFTTMSSENQHKGYVLFEPEFMHTYMNALDAGKSMIAQLPKQKPAWRVPNFPAQ